MQVVADLHLHSKYSRATSKSMDFEHITRYAKLKGLNLVTVADFTHPKHFEEIKKLDERDGVVYYKGFPMLLTTEISLMFSDTKQRRVHLLVFAPSVEVVSQINDVLNKMGRLDYDGRPIFGISCVDFLDLMLSISKEIEIVPAHCMTPWFGIYGSKSGFDSIVEAFGDRASYIHAVETGLSADPSMLWRLDDVNTFELNLLSFSDSHSYWPWRLGREATIFEIKKLSYSCIIEAIRNKNNLSHNKSGHNSITATIEVDPAYGKYHYDGHRQCNVVLSPQEAMKLNNICPVCGRPLTIGVEHRIEELAVKPQGFKPSHAKPYFKLLPLHELIATIYKTTVQSKKAWNIYNRLISAFGNELNVLLNVKPEQLSRYVDRTLVNAIMRNRQGKIKVKPGYDGVYGAIIAEQATLV